MHTNINHQVSFEAAQVYETHIEEMLKALNSKMLIRAKEKDLIGDNPVSVMLDNHRNHAMFMANVFKLNDYAMLKKTIPWVIQSYTKRGFHEDYFYDVCSQWIDVINEKLQMPYAKEIIGVYQWMIEYIKETDCWTPSRSWDNEYPYGKKWEERVGEFTAFLLSGDSTGALAYSKEHIQSKHDLSDFYIKIVTHAMYKVGKLWEQGKISVAQEHLASSIVLRIMSALYMGISDLSVTKGKVIVTATDNEHHEIGARIIADFLEMDGWNVIYLGSNVPEKDLLKTIKEENPTIICLSVTMVFNIDHVQDIILKIREQNKQNSMKIVVGGYAFSRATIDDRKLGADEILLNGEELILYANELWKNFEIPKN